MILTCPACGTQYVVKDGAIPPGGRQVRCASCRHSWHQDPDDTDAGDAVEGQDEHGRPDDLQPVHPAADPASLPDEPDGASQDAAAARPEPVVDDEERNAEEMAAMAAMPEVTADDGYERQSVASASVDDDFTPFAAQEERRKRGSLGLGLVAAFGLIVIAAIAFWFLAPAEWKERVGLSEQRATPLQLMMTHSDRQRLASGNELLAISGRVINPTEKRQTVPPITAQLRDAKGKLVYSWTIAPPAPSLKGGDSASFYSAEVNVPAGGDELTVTLGAPKKAG
jgi:predicted Zn finger-like uncharacterized protein